MKKTLLIILLLIFSVNLFSQNFKIPKIDWEGKTETENIYANLLKLKDRNSLIVKIGYSTSFAEGQSSEFIVYQNDGSVKRFVAYNLHSTEFKTKIKRKRIKKKEHKYYWKYLNNCIKEKKYKIEKNKLNITKKKGEEKGKATLTTMYISHTVNYHFWIVQGENYIAYGSTSPKAYIDSKFPGYEERQKLVDLINGFEKLIEKY
ncbi:hypothetical protein [uncultured Aquimarina sp.]|uniref:hypothetical protein n=1 Tax=uncultured Aquimarina sp. TaxID=575652 RepID=UPI00260DD257|nr:hypothetical protein [uncultured Aquimarina sp.]